MTVIRSASYFDVCFISPCTVLTSKFLSQNTTELSSPAIFLAPHKILQRPPWLDTLPFLALIFFALPTKHPTTRSSSSPIFAWRQSTFSSGVTYRYRLYSSGRRYSFIQDPETYAHPVHATERIEEGVSGADPFRSSDSNGHLICHRTDQCPRNGCESIDVALYRIDQWVTRTLLRPLFCIGLPPPALEQASVPLSNPSQNLLTLTTWTPDA